MSLARVVVRSDGRCLWSARRSHRYSKTETSLPSVWRRAVAESTGQYGFHARTYCPETPRRFARCWESFSTKLSRNKTTDFMKKKLGISNQQAYLSAYKAARRGLVWVELCNIFEEPEDNKSVAMCAFTGSSSIYQDGLYGNCCLASLEHLAVSEKEQFIQGARSRKEEVLPLLRAALPAYLFIIGRRQSLPRLLIEGVPLLAENKAKEFSRLSITNFQEYFKAVHIQQ